MASKKKKARKVAKARAANKATRKKAKRKYTRKAAPEKDNLPVPAHLNNLPRAMRNVPPRMLMLNKAMQAVGVDMNPVLGDPLFAFNGIADLKKAFWNNLHPVVGNVDHENASDLRVQNSTTGHSIDMILLQLGKMATAPTQQIRKDTLLNLAAYTAILYEAADSQGMLSGE